MQYSCWIFTVMVTTAYYVYLNLSYFSFVFRDVALLCFKIQVLLNIITKYFAVERKYGKMGLG